MTHFCLWHTNMIYHLFPTMYVLANYTPNALSILKESSNHQRTPLYNKFNANMGHSTS